MFAAKLYADPATGQNGPAARNHTIPQKRMENHPRVGLDRSDDVDNFGCSAVSGVGSTFGDETSSGGVGRADMSERDKARCMLGGQVVSTAFETSEDVGAARAEARDFLHGLRSVYGLAVSDEAVESVQLVVSELVTNTHKYAPGPCLVTLVLGEGVVEVSVRDGSSAMPQILEPDPERIGRHGLEIVMALCRSFGIHREPDGKHVKATLALNDTASA
ncbi:ATP-binding protein [Streptomyces sp. NPDC057217]|uniref:ATP-binding protein n=1 Tax=Streptomyces sp. NPDC057217 TaxID=3346054 RepID=UPI003630C928